MMSLNDVSYFFSSSGIFSNSVKSNHGYLDKAKKLISIIKKLYYVSMNSVLFFAKVIKSDEAK
jgi:hypothetical protein